MSRIMRSRSLRRAGVLVFAVLWLVPVEIPLILPDFGPIRSAAAQYGQDPGQVPGGQDLGGIDPFGQMPTDDMDMQLPGRTRSRAARKRTRLPEKGASKKADAKAKTKADSSGQLQFSQDIAPILIANCSGCHTKDGQGVKRGKLDMTTFEKLQKGSDKHKVIEPKKPEQSELVRRINDDGEERMPPPGNNRGKLSADAIAKITRWIKEGARLDQGLDPKVAMESYAATPEQLRRRQLAQTPTKERDQKVIEAGQARWKQSGSKQKPEVVPGTHFIMFSNLPNDRATSTLKAMESQYNHLRRWLNSPSMDWPEKVSLFVFNSNNEFIEFVRSLESRDVDSQEPRVSAKLKIPQPYIAATDPSGGKREEPTRRRAKSKKAEESENAGSDRSLLGLLTEGLGSGSVDAAGNAPRWLRDGLGLFMAHAVEPRSPYYRHLRATAFQNVDQGWPTKATQALGGELTAEDQRAVSFALVECMMRSEVFSQRFPAFVRGLLERGQEALDDELKNVYNGTREEFLNLTGEWVAGAYGQVQ